MAAARISIRLQPGAGRDELVGWREERLVVRVSAPALEGRANKALVKLLGKTLRVPQSQLTIVSGERSRDKLIQIGELTQAEVDARLSFRSTA